MPPIVRRFDLVTEADALALEPGSSIVLARGGRVTPLGRDVLAARRIRVIPEESDQAGAGLQQTPSPPLTALQLAALIDHTLLRPGARAVDLVQLCEEANAHGFATVCVNPVWVAACARLLEGTRVRVCSVVGFPLGASTTAVKVHETQQAIGDGAREIDAVMDIGALRGGDLRRVRQDLQAVLSVARGEGALGKVILETALLTDPEKVEACRIAVSAGADYVKTSTGFGPGGATVEDVALMRRTVGDAVGVKAAGGIRTLDQVYALLGAGATRIGTSSGAQILGSLPGVVQAR